SLFNTVATLY
nr:Chain C, HIV-1 peptide [synthetic construct]3GIV_F Chain F, HIV-1 peptide [synthetic construct]